MRRRDRRVAELTAIVLTGMELARIGEVAVRDVPVGTEFKLADLVSTVDWDAARVGVRRHAGTLFLAKMRATATVECLGRDDENHQRYRRLV